MAARRLVVHIGTPKTGTTSIQDALARLAPALRERGIGAPSAGRRHAASARHANLLGSLTGFRYDAARGGVGRAGRGDPRLGRPLVRHFRRGAGAHAAESRCRRRLRR